jgi:4-hydroxybenzoate polyprenyltransferase
LELTKQNSDDKVKFKNLTWFFLASTSLLLTGFFASDNKDLMSLFLLIWCNIIGVFLVYRLNDIIDQNSEFSFNLKNFFSYKLHSIVVFQFVFITIPLALYYLNLFVVLLLSIGAVFGILYSISFRIGNCVYRIKNVFLIKNILIGLVWGGLVLIGAGIMGNELVWLIFVFASVQVFIGGILRDIPDLEKDKFSGVKSLPVVIGVSKTILFVHLVNLGFLVFCFLNQYDQLFLIFCTIPTLWRMLNIELLRREPNKRIWSQSLNLFTCILIMISFLIVKNYDIIFK